MDKSVQLLKLLRGLQKGGGVLQIAEVKTAAPNPVTLIFQGTNLALDLDIFEVPADFQPLQVGNKFFALPIAGDAVAPRWGLIKKL